MLVAKTDDQNNNINNNIDCSQSVISTIGGMTSSEVVTSSTSGDPSTFQCIFLKFWVGRYVSNSRKYSILFWIINECVYALYNSGTFLIYVKPI
ncbi:unnamed protein product [Meloidogyne enterolobii]|uniref:Uncharacterized protein n=1 Tax=Meloidogyne enterolobii TaxID=390850 RepID=A0ACB1B5F1_MELEN